MIGCSRSPEIDVRSPLVVITGFIFAFDTALKYSDKHLCFVTRVAFCEDFLSLVFLFGLPIFPGFFAVNPIICTVDISGVGI